MTDDRRPTDDGRPTEDRPPASFESRLPHGDRSPLIPVAALVILVGIAVLTSRPAVSGFADGPAPGAADGAGPGSPPPAAQPPSAPAAVADEAVAAICLEPGSWRTATIETWRDQTVRVWRAIDPTPASGPDDPAIPIVPAVGTRIPAIGFCAPIVGPDKPAGAATIDAWRRNPAVDPATGAVTAASPIELHGLVPEGSPSPFGALFGPSDPTSAASGWPPGVVVFRYTSLAAGQASVATWFGIEVVETDASGKEPPSPLRSAAPGGPTLRP
jgi:hypothetical protein